MPSRAIGIGFELLGEHGDVGEADDARVALERVKLAKHLVVRFRRGRPVREGGPRRVDALEAFERDRAEPRDQRFRECERSLPLTYRLG
jgi:hypothetical protein